MKTTLLCILLALSGLLSAQTIDNPSFKARTGSIATITRIERNPGNTRVYVHVVYRPHWWISIDGDDYLEDTATGKRYMFRSAEGIEVKKEVYLPDSGEMDYVLLFDPLPKETKTIHFISPGTSTEWNTYDISLIPQTGKNVPPLHAVRGNWFGTEDSSTWKYGIYDSLTLMNNRIYTNESIRKKGKRIELTVKDKQTGETTTLLLTPQKNGTCKIRTDKATEQVYSRQRMPAKTIAAEADFQQFFRTDTACLQGYIDGYDPRLGFDTGIIYLENSLTREDYPTVVQIEPDGSFCCKFVLNHPVESSVVVTNCHFSFYIEPGQTLTLYIDWEDILARNRACNYYFPIKNTAYMGPSAALSYLLNDFSKLVFYRYEDLSKSQKTLTPNEYREHMKPFIARWKQVTDSLSRIYQPSAKAVHLINNKTALQIGTAFFEYAMQRDYYAKQDTTNAALQVVEDDSYYDFLPKMPLNDETMLASTHAEVFLNRFEYMNPLRKARYHYPQSQSSDSISYTYPEKTLLVFLKEKGVKLNAAQEALRRKQEKLAGVTVKIKWEELAQEHQQISDLLKKEGKLVDEYRKYLQSLPQEEEDPQEEIRKKEKNDKMHIGVYQDYEQQRDEIIARLCNEPNLLLWQIAKVRQLNYHLGNIETNRLAREYVDSLKQQFSQPFLIAEAERMCVKTHPEEDATSYQLPQGKATEIFRNIIKNHPGKVLFVDFWATTCGPCRSGIEATANLRKKYKDHPEFQFIYITGDKDSPEGDYKQYVEKHLKGEASYYVSDTEFNYLRQLFHFNGIPHYELVEKDGSISFKDVHTYNLEEYLIEHFPLHHK